VEIIYFVNSAHKKFFYVIMVSALFNGEVRYEKFNGLEFFFLNRLNNTYRILFLGKQGCDLGARNSTKIYLHEREG
jgi:hypothetical protein